MDEVQPGLAQQGARAVRNAMVVVGLVASDAATIAHRIELRLRGIAPERPPPRLPASALSALASAFRAACEEAPDGRLRKALDEELISLAMAHGGSTEDDKRRPPGPDAPFPNRRSRYRVIFDEAPMSIVVIDGGGRVIDANAAHWLMMGADPDAVGDSVGASVLDLPAAQEPGVHERLVGVLAGTPFDLRHQAYTSPYSNRELKLNVRGVPLHDDDGGVTGALILSEDVTEEAKLAEQLVRAQKMESLGTLAGGIAHEFNNLLSGILGHASLLRSRIPHTDSLQRHVTRVEESAHRAAELTQQLMAFSRDAEPERKVFDAGQLVRELASLLERTVPANVRVAVDRSADDALVEANRTQLQQALLNVCTNARDAMPSGGELRLTVKSTDAPPPARAGSSVPRWVHLGVEDTGLGMEEAVLKRVFDPFFTTKPPGQGTGLGLAITYRIVEAHSGAVDLRSTPGHGTIVDIWLPGSDRAPEVTLDARPRPMPGHGTILVVDDEPILLELMHDILGELGYEILLAEDGVEAMDIYDMRWRSIDLVLLDVVMPRMGGRETLNAMRGINPEVRVVLCSGYLRETDVDAPPMAGVHGFLRKPYDREKLANAVARALGG